MSRLSEMTQKEQWAERVGKGKLLRTIGQPRFEDAKTNDGGVLRISRPDSKHSMTGGSLQDL